MPLSRLALGEVVVGTIKTQFTFGTLKSPHSTIEVESGVIASEFPRYTNTQGLEDAGL